MGPLLRQPRASSSPAPVGAERASESFECVIDRDFMLLPLRTLPRCHPFLGKVP